MFSLYVKEMKKFKVAVILLILVFSLGSGAVNSSTRYWLIPMTKMLIDSTETYFLKFTSWQKSVSWKIKVYSPLADPVWSWHHWNGDERDGPSILLQRRSISNIICQCDASVNILICLIIYPILIKYCVLVWTLPIDWL